VVVVLGVFALGVLGRILFQGHRGTPWWEGASNKEFWDYLELLIVPTVLAIGVALLNWAQRQREREAEEVRRERELEVDDQRAQEVALQAYLDQLTLLLLNKQDDQLVRTTVEDDVRQVVQARAEPLLRSLNATRRWSLILFLAVVGLLARDQPLVSLAGTNLRGVNGRRAPLQNVDLGGADLAGADLRAADLSDANLSDANLSGAILTAAILFNADLSWADLSDANLSGAILSGARLRGTVLRDAHLGEAILLGAEGLTEEELKGQLSTAKSLEGATMPDGQTLRSYLNLELPTFEEWLKSKGRGEDGKDSGRS
jgi:uncharacterized protein YjbI with pentapeptide repeats